MCCMVSCKYTEGKRTELLLKKSDKKNGASNGNGERKGEGKGGYRGYMSYQKTAGTTVGKARLMDIASCYSKWSSLILDFPCCYSSGRRYILFIAVTFSDHSLRERVNYPQCLSVLEKL